MKTGTHRAVAELERRAGARLAAVHANLQRLARCRTEVIAVHSRARKELLGRKQWSAFACVALSAHTVWTAAAAANFAAAQRAEASNGALLAGEKMYWARCRRGLERRARAGRQLKPWPD